MHALSLASPALPPEPAWSDAVVATTVDQDHYRLDDGRLAQRALSCLVQPLAGDRVLVAALADGECRIVHILVRETAAAASLSVAGAPALAIRAPNLALDATNKLALRSLGDAEMTAAAGNLSLQGRNIFATAADTLVQHAEHWIGRLGHALLEARQLFRLHGQHTVVTAEKDVKIDGERISMG